MGASCPALNSEGAAKCGKSFDVPWIECLASPPSGNLTRDRDMFEGVMAQVWMDNYAQGPLDDLRDYCLRVDWPITIRPDKGWIALLREAINEGPFEPLARWPGNDWDWALETLMAEWLLRGPESILPLLRALAQPGSRPALAFIVVDSYLTDGPYPLTPEIQSLIQDAVPLVGDYDDEAAEYLIHALHDSGMREAIVALEPSLTEGHTLAHRTLREYLASPVHE